MTGYRTTTVPVRGGELTVGVWGPDDGVPLLAIHGITATHRTWPLLAAALPGTRLITPDLRGRGRSNQLPGPWGMPRHADDMTAVLDAFGLGRVDVLGHSMGGFVAASLAMAHPGRVGALVLLDGGLPIPAPPGVAPEDLPAALIGPAATRLAMRFTSPQAYRDFWRPHPAFAADWGPVIEQYVDYDLEGEPPEFRSSAAIAAVTQDSLQLSGDPGYADRLAALPMRVDFVRAPRGLLDEPPGLYPAAQVTEWGRRMPRLVTHEARNVNHYTLVLTERGIDQVVPVLREALARGEETTEVSA